MAAMSGLTRPSTASQLGDKILGCLSRLQPSETIEHLVRYLGTWSGSEYVFRVLLDYQ